MQNFPAQRLLNAPFWFAAILLAALVVTGARAETPPRASDTDVRILIDISGSMVETDPRNYRTPAINLLIDSLPENSRSGIWSFGQYVNLLMPHETVDAAWREQARTRVAELRPIAQRTHIGAVLDKAAYDFGYSTYAPPTDVVLITDGQVDIAPNDSVNQVERDRILSSVIPRYAAAGARIHTLALTRAADTGLLEQMALRTQGVYAQIDSASDIRSFILRVLSTVSPGNELPLDNAGFDVDEQASEVTAMILHETGQIGLRSPGQSETSALNPGSQRWRVGDGYTLVTVDDPQTGRWQISGAVGDGSRVSVVSDLNLEWRMPEESVVIRNRPLTIELAAVDETGAPVATELTGVMVPELRINGQSFTALRWNENRLRAQIPNRFDEGPLDLEVSVDAQTFQRIARRTVQNRPALTAEVLVVDDGYQWRLYPSHPALEVEGPQLSASIEGPEGDTGAQTFQRHATGYFYLDLEGDRPSGDYRLEAGGRLTINDRSLTDLGVAPVTLSFPVATDRPRIMNLDAAPKPAAEAPEPEPQPEMEAEAEAVESAFVKEPMPEFEEISAEATVAEAPSPEPDSEAPAAPSVPSDETPWLMYALYSLPGIAVLVGFFMVYRTLEQRGQSRSEDLLAEEPTFGNDELGDIDELDFAAGIDAIDDTEDEFTAGPSKERRAEAGTQPGEAPLVNEVVDDDFELDYEDPPMPEKTEAPRFDMEDNLDTSLLDQDEPDDLDGSADDDLDVDDDLFDISNIDDSLADLDELELDEDDSFTFDEDDDEDDKEDNKRD